MSEFVRANRKKKYERFLLVRGEFFHQPMLTNHVAEFLFSLCVARIKSPSGKYCRLNLPGDGRRKSKIFQNLPMVSNFHLLHKHCQNDHIVASMSWANEELKLLRNIVSHCGQTTKHFCEKYCFLPMFCHVFQCEQTGSHG